MRFAGCADTPLCRTWLADVVSGDAASPCPRWSWCRRPDHDQSARVQDAERHREAFGFCDNLRSQPHCQIVEPGERHWDIFRRLCVGTDTRGSRITDAWLAALAIEWGCEWITLDRDYARFRN